MKKIENLSTIINYISFHVLIHYDFSLLTTHILTLYLFIPCFIALIFGTESTAQRDKMGGQKFDQETRRAEIMAESMEHACEPRFGYFGMVSPLAVGDNSGQPMKKKFENFKTPNIQAHATKKGATVVSYCTVFSRLIFNYNF